MALTTPPLPLKSSQEYNPFYWIIRLESQHKTLMNRSLRGIGLDVPSWLVLGILEARGECSMSDLAAQASANLSTMTKIVYRLQEQGLVNTSTSLNDARVTNVRMTETGREALRQSEETTAHLFERSLQGFNLAQLKKLNLQLEKLLANLF